MVAHLGTALKFKSASRRDYVIVAPETDAPSQPDVFKGISFDDEVKVSVDSGSSYNMNSNRPDADSGPYIEPDTFGMNTVIVEPPNPSNSVALAQYSPKPYTVTPCDSEKAGIRGCRKYTGSR